MTPNATRRLFFVTGPLAAGLIGAAMTSLVSQPALANSKFADQTGMACTQCHESGKSGGKLTAFGEKFKANGNKVPATPAK